MNLRDNDFELFGCAISFAVDLRVLDATHKSLLRKVHPDKFTAQGAAAQRLALQWSARINEAYARLKDPLRRAAYLCELRGSRIETHGNTAPLPAAFLSQQIDWRERLEQAHTAADFALLQQTIAATQSQMMGALQAALDKPAGHENLREATGLVHSLMFVEKFKADVSLRQHQQQMLALRTQHPDDGLRSGL